MSSGTSPSSRRLDSPARAGGLADGGSRGTIGAPQPPNPPWLKVIGTTLKLWVRRRVLRVPDTGKVSALRGASLSAAVVVVVAAVVVGAVALTGSQPRRADSHPRHHTPAKPVITPAEAAATANDKAAATWIAAQVSQQAVIDCDPAMCADLQAAGYPSAQLSTVQSGSSLQTGAAAADLVADTAALRLSDGTQALSVAPDVIASFGTGPEAVQLRLVVAGGPAGYQRDARKALTARRKAGRALVSAGTLSMRAAARQDLRAGLVDPRLVTVLRRLAARKSVYLLRFTESGPPGSPATPYRQAAIDGLVSGTGSHRVSELSAVLKLLAGQRPPDNAQVTVTHQSRGRIIVDITFPAPSPF